jgi:large subunit ribosomal protein L4
MNRLAASFARNVRVSNSFSAVRSYCGTRLLQSTLPSNLQLADASILEAEPEIDFPVLNYSFATLDVPADIIVKKFLQPDAKPTELTAAPLERKIFEVAIRKDIIHNVIRYIRHKKRQPKKLKRLNEISGSKKKPRPQKGTGQSQVGNKRNSVWRGGQKAFGPVLRDYSIELNRKVRALGMMMTLAAKFREGNLLIFDSLTVPTSRTKDLSALLAQHGLAESSLMIVELDYALDANFELASRNLRDVDVRERRHCNVYEILKKDKLVLSQRVFEDIQQRLLYQYTYSPKRRTMQQQQMLLEECAELVELRNLENAKANA